ncbi:MAG TPA: plasmid segregation centromere-binding protein ParR [Cyanobacteria bacterium UBA8553]|nr:plasmid segregation centromere-binding protein ParR [Cyanobacteria bacterium UBA8553]HAJ60737.1 plasmid segregation centromere-binding protein ParR [Cyanobacteria bacterium UBA8543]
MFDWTFPWSKKIRKSVTFNREVADQSLLDVVEIELMRQPHKSFSDLCKEALWHSLRVPESTRPPSKKAQIEQHFAELQQQIADFEQRVFAKESNQLDAMERQLNQLSVQLSQLAIALNQQPSFQPPPQLESKTELEAPIPPQEVDPLLSRLSQFLDDF